MARASRNLALPGTDLADMFDYGVEFSLRIDLNGGNGGYGNERVRKVRPLREVDVLISALTWHVRKARNHRAMEVSYSHGS